MPDDHVRISAHLRDHKPGTLTAAVEAITAVLRAQDGDVAMASHGRRGRLAVTATGDVGDQGEAERLIETLEGQGASSVMVHLFYEQVGEELVIARVARQIAHFNSEAELNQARRQRLAEPAPALDFVAEPRQACAVVRLTCNSPGNRRALHGIFALAVGEHRDALQAVRYKLQRRFRSRDYEVEWCRYRQRVRGPTDWVEGPATLTYGARQTKKTTLDLYLGFDLRALTVPNGDAPLADAPDQFAHLLLVLSLLRGVDRAWVKLWSSDGTFRYGYWPMPGDEPHMGAMDPLPDADWPLF